MQIELQGLTARHPAARPAAAPALADLGLRIEPGEQVAVIGPSGAGKTTLLQVLGLSMQPVSGSLRLDGADPWALSHRQRQKLRGRLFLAPQVPPLPPRQRVVTSVLAGQLPTLSLLASLRSLFYPRDIGAAYEALQAFDAGDKLFERVDRLSGGERQRVGLARALVSPARMWLVDEPLSALDPARSRMAIESVTGRARQAGITLVATLHQVDVALAHFPRVIGLRDGRLAFDLPAQDVTQERLARLYEQFEHELRGQAPAGAAALGEGSDGRNGGGGAIGAAAAAAPATQPVVMHCR